MKALEPLLIEAKTAASLLGVGRTLLYQMAADGRLGPVPLKFSGKTLFRYRELCEWVESGCPGREKWLQILGAE